MTKYHYGNYEQLNTITQNSQRDFAAIERLEIEKRKLEVGKNEQKYDI